MVPEKALARLSRKRRLDQLQSDLDVAVGDENYEEAARLRDLISQAKESLNIS